MQVLREEGVSVVQTSFLSEGVPPPRADPRVIRIEVRGTPAPQGSKRFVGMAGGRGVMVESSKKVKPWREDVRNAALAVRESMRLQVLDGPLNVHMAFTLPKPASAPRTRRSYPCRKPDLSKLVRSTEDALTEAGIWADDARIVDLRCLKCFPLEHEYSMSSPGCIIVIQRVDAL